MMVVALSVKKSRQMEIPEIKGWIGLFPSKALDIHSMTLNQKYNVRIIVTHSCGISGVVLLEPDDFDAKKSKAG
jgi:hypothetical protein